MADNGADPVRWCQSLKDDDTLCGQRATHVVRGRPGYWWQGFHCATHATEVAQHYGHQGGCEVLLIDGGEL